MGWWRQKKCFTKVQKRRIYVALGATDYGFQAVKGLFHNCPGDERPWRAPRASQLETKGQRRRMARALRETDLTKAQRRRMGRALRETQNKFQAVKLSLGPWRTLKATNMTKAQRCHMGRALKPTDFGFQPVKIPLVAQQGELNKGAEEELSAGAQAPSSTSTSTSTAASINAAEPQSMVIEAEVVEVEALTLIQRIRRLRQTNLAARRTTLPATTNVYN
jgi:hypothetical protein